jgi:hypothetical protein
MFCPTCGNPVTAEAVYCSKCGDTLTAAIAARSGPSNTRLAVAAVAAAAAVGLALWSSLRPKPAADAPPTQASVPRLAATPSATPSPSATFDVLSPIDPGEYQTYYNDRFDYSIAYPSNFLQPQGVSGNGDGQRFVSRDNRVRMAVFGRLNAPEKSLEALFNEELTPSRTITYKVLKDKWFVVSGYEGDKVFYLKARLKDDTIKTFFIEADRALQPLMQPITEKIAKSFK